MTKTEKILCCHGNLTAKSTANVLRINKDVVYQTWWYHRLKAVKRYPERMMPTFIKRRK